MAVFCQHRKFGSSRNHPAKIKGRGLDAMEDGRRYANNTQTHFELLGNVEHGRQKVFCVSCSLLHYFRRMVPHLGHHE